MRTRFTLLEVLVAVMIAATLLLSADVVFEQLADSRETAARAAVMRDQSQNAMALVHRWVRQVDLSPGSGAGLTTHAFAGDGATARFTSSCIAPGGWERECDVTLHVISDSDGSALVAISSVGDSVQLHMRQHMPQHMRQQPLVLRYLIDAAGDGHWTSSWPSGPTAPLAIGIVSLADTIVCRIGARG